MTNRLLWSPLAIGTLLLIIKKLNMYLFDDKNSLATKDVEICDTNHAENNKQLTNNICALNLSYYILAVFAVWSSFYLFYIMEYFAHQNCALAQVS